jgi:hypothetical protein
MASGGAMMSGGSVLQGGVVISGGRTSQGAWRWSLGQTSATAMKCSEALSYCLNIGLWLPTSRELLSIVDLTMSYPDPAIDRKAFLEVSAEGYWTARCQPSTHCSTMDHT